MDIQIEKLKNRIINILDSYSGRMVLYLDIPPKKNKNSLLSTSGEFLFLTNYHEKKNYLKNLDNLKTTNPNKRT